MKTIFINFIALFLLLALAACSTTPSQAVSGPGKFDNQARIAIVTTDQEQLDALLPQCLASRKIPVGEKTFVLGEIHGAPVVMVNCGKSMVNAAATTQNTIDLFNIQRILVVGLAAAINPKLHPGDIVTPGKWAQNGEMLMALQRGENYWDINTNTTNFFNDGIHFGMMFPRAVEINRKGKTQQVYWFETAADMNQVISSVTANIHLDTMENLIPSTRQPTVTSGGNGVSSQAEIDNPEYRDWLWQNFKADVADTETAAVAQVALINNIPFCAFLGIGEKAGEEVSPEDQKIKDITRRNVADFTILFLNNYIRDVKPFATKN